MDLKKTFVAVGLCATLLLSGCGMNNTGKGALIGGGGGAGVGAGVGAIIGGGKGAAIGAGVGAAVGAGVGALIGNKMDKQQKELEAALKDAQVEETTDANGLQAIKVTFPGGILFPTGKWTLNNSAKQELDNFAASLAQNPLTDVRIIGYTDNTGSMAANTKVSTNRADAVLQYLVGKGVTPTRLAAEGVPMADYVATNETAEGRALNRRVEVYVYASEQMIQQAESGNLK